jgi:hypothetical protein
VPHFPNGLGAGVLYLPATICASQNMSYYSPMKNPVKRATLLQDALAELIQVEETLL